MPYGNYYAKQVVAPKGFELFSDRIILDNVYQYTWSGLTVYYAQAENTPIKLDTSTVRVNLTNEFKAPINCAEFELFSDVECQNLIDTAITDNNGIAEFAKPLQVGTYYIKQKKSAVGYFYDSTVTEVVVKEENIGSNTDISLFAKSKGDVNKDGNIDITDSTVIQLFVAGEKAEDGSDFVDINDTVSFDNANIDGNGIIDINDITNLQIIISKNN